MQERAGLLHGNDTGFFEGGTGIRSARPSHEVPHGRAHPHAQVRPYLLQGADDWAGRTGQGERRSDTDTLERVQAGGAVGEGVGTLGRKLHRRL